MPKKQKSTNSAPNVRHSTIWNRVGGGFSNPGESRVCKVGRHKVLITRSPYLNKYGTPVHTATLINRDGSLGESYRDTGSATYIVENALKKNGIRTKGR